MRPCSKSCNVYCKYVLASRWIKCNIYQMYYGINYIWLLKDHKIDAKMYRNVNMINLSSFGTVELPACLAGI